MEWRGSLRKKIVHITFQGILPTIILMRTLSIDSSSLIPDSTRIQYVFPVWFPPRHYQTPIVYREVLFIRFPVQLRDGSGAFQSIIALLCDYGI